MHALKFISGTLCLLILGVVGLAATGSSGSSPPTGMVVVGLEAEPRSLDPHVTTAASDFRIAVNIYEGLVRFKRGTLEPGPALARTWEISEDGRHYTFYLRPGVRFHDGTPFNAEAVKFNFERMLDSDHPEHDTGPFPLAFFFETVRRVVVVDPLTVRFDLGEAFAPLLANLAFPSGLIVSPAAVRTYGKDVARHPVGTGAFSFAGWAQGVVRLSRNDAYWGQLAKTKSLTFEVIGDPMTRVAALSAGHIDVAVELGPDSVDYFRHADRFSIAETSGPHLWFLLLNTRRPPLDDVRVRRALNLAVNKEALVSQVLLGTAEVAAGPIAAAFGDHAGDVQPYPYDPKRARELLRDAEVAPGTELLLLAPNSGSGMLAPVQMATAIQADLAVVGINVIIETFEWNSYLTEVNAGLERAHMAEMAWMTNDPDTLPYLALRSEAMPPKGFNSGWYVNRSVDDALALARRATDPNQRAQLYAGVQRRVHDEAPWLFVASWRQNVVFSQRVSGMYLEPSFLLYLEEVAKR